MGRFAAALASLLACVLSLATPASAQEGPWRLVERAGVVRVARPGASAAEGVRNQELNVGAIITTGADGRAVLSNDAQRITMAANSRIVIAPETTPGFTRILQDLGSALFQVDRRQSPHFSVETPLLAAVVKGTTFTVTVGIQDNVVHVAEGLVEVRANSGGASDVASGVTARVSSTAPAVVSVTTPSPTAAAPASAVAPMNYSESSNGLFNASPTGVDASMARGANAGNGALNSNGASLGALNGNGASLGALNGDAASLGALNGNGAGSVDPGSSGGGAAAAVGGGAAGAAGGAAGAAGGAAGAAGGAAGSIVRGRGASGS